MSRAVGIVNLEPNRHLVDKIMMSISSIGESDFYLSATELDSHANMVVIGKQAFVYIHSVQYANVQAFEKEVKGLPKVPIVDAATAYDFQTSGETYLLVVRNSLCVPTMEINLIPPFILREASLVLNYTPKIHCDDPSI